MKQRHLYDRRTRLLLAWAARALVLAYIFQIGAFDHHGGIDPAELVGVPNTSFHAHAAHCHGDVSGCADSTSLASTMVEQPLTVPAPSVHAFALEPGRVAPAEAAVATLHQPPRAA